MRYSLIWVLIAACQPAPDETGSPETGTDSTPTLDTAPPVVPIPVPADQAFGTPATLSSGGLVTCADPARRAAVGPMVLTRGEVREVGSGFRGHSGPIIADIDGDGFDDIMMADGDRMLRVYKNGPDGLTDVTGQWIKANVQYFTGGAAADYDDDGDLDVILTRQDLHPVFVRNDGGILTTITTEAGITGLEGGNYGAAWGDVDGDGDLDLFISGYGKSEQGMDLENIEDGVDSALYIQQPDHTFINDSVRFPAVVHPGWTFTPTFIDIENDGDLDLYLVNDFGDYGVPNQLLLNEGHGYFTVAPVGTGLDLAFNGMGTSLADLNEDGVPDFFIPSWGSVALMVSSSSGRWVNQATAFGVQPDAARNQTVAWGGVLADMNNDGLTDLYVPYGYQNATTNFTNEPDQPDALLIADGTGQLIDVAAEWGMASTLASRGAQLADLNRDGYLDVVKFNRNVDPNEMFFSQCGADHWLTVRLKQPAPNVDAVNAQVRVWAGGKMYTSYMLAGGTSFAGAAPLEAHFGLGTHTQVDRLEVRWPDGALSNFRDVPTNHHLRVQRQLTRPHDPTQPKAK